VRAGGRDSSWINTAMDGEETARVMSCAQERPKKIRWLTSYSWTGEIAG